MILDGRSNGRRARRASRDLLPGGKGARRRVVPLDQRPSSNAGWCSAGRPIEALPERLGDGFRTAPSVVQRNGGHGKSGDVQRLVTGHATEEGGSRWLSTATRSGSFSTGPG